MIRFCCKLLFVLASQANSVLATDWIRAGLNTNQSVWGISGGLLWGVAPAGFRGGEPRGLIRLGYPVLEKGGYDLINFIAIEPIVRGRRGFSELERSPLDGVPGKKIWAEPGQSGVATELCPGECRRNEHGVEELELKLLVEKFDNGAHVRLVARQWSDKPGELELAVFKQQDSEPLDSCILTATMGNMARARLLWLKDRVVSSVQLYPNYKESGFAPHKEFGLSELHRNKDGDVLVAISTNEKSPATVYPFPGSDLWHYAGERVTQYWRVPAKVDTTLRAVVNGRFKYWRSDQPVPGGIAFENFELCESFHQGQTFVFGITRAEPNKLGL